VDLTTAAFLAQIGHEALCSENDEDNLLKLQSGVMPIFEPGLEQIVAEAVRKGSPSVRRKRPSSRHRQSSFVLDVLELRVLLDQSGLRLGSREEAQLCLPQMKWCLARSRGRARTRLKGGHG
jgi:hypothetical protein